MVLQWLRMLRQRVAPNWDKYDYLILGLISSPLLAFAFLDFFGYAFAPQYLLAGVAAISAFIAIYQLRHPTSKSKSESPTVQPSFDSADDQADFGLRNFGPGPALYLQLVVKVNGERLLELHPTEQPLHLDEGDFYSVLHGDLYDVVGGDAVGEAEFYYTFVSSHGARVPADVGDVFRDHDSTNYLKEVASEDRTPRRVPLQRIRDVVDEN